MCRKLSCLSLALAVCLLSLACKRDEDVGKVVDELNAFTAEVVKRVDANPSAAGVDDAQKYFDSRKEEVKGRLASIKNVREAQVSAETMQKMKESFGNNATTIAKLQLKYLNQSMSDPAMRPKLAKLMQDYNALLLSIGQ